MTGAAHVNVNTCQTSCQLLVELISYCHSWNIPLNTPTLPLNTHHMGVGVGVGVGIQNSTHTHTHRAPTPSTHMSYPHPHYSLISGRAKGQQRSEKTEEGTGEFMGGIYTIQWRHRITKKQREHNREHSRETMDDKWISKVDGTEGNDKCNNGSDMTA